MKVIENLRYRADGQGYVEPGYTHLFVVPAEGGTPRQLTSGDYHHGGPLSWSRDGSRLYFSANRLDDWEHEPVESEVWSVDVASGALTALTGRDGPDFAPVVSPDGRRIAWLGFDDRKMGYHTTRVHVMDADGSNKRVVNADFDRSIDALQWAGNSGRLYVQYDDRGMSHVGLMTLDGDIDTRVSDVSGISLGRPYTSGGFHAGGDGDFVYTRGTAYRPADVGIAGRRGEPRQLTQLNEDLLAHRELGEVEQLTWTSSADGLEIEGWLVRPPDFDADRDYPLVLEIHGGPFAAYGPHFSVEAQLYAAAGYVVLYANPRGSTSYGYDFANEIHHNYPGEDYDDLVSGVDAVLERGYVDPDRLFVTGGSGGGVLTAWIVGKTDRFAAAVSAKPVINWTSMTGTADISSFVSNYWFAEMPWDDPEAYWRRSPLSLVGNVTTPTMLLTGEQDFRTPISESEQFYQALQLRRVDTALVRVPEASHGIAARPSHLIAKVDNVLAWFARYGGPERE
ncbi:MAG: S9 family peptidase [Woeseiaceae bacterium]|nr:S9 family peptidase [Woeseiaceae bacterium]